MLMLVLRNSELEKQVVQTHFLTIFSIMEWFRNGEMVLA